MEFLHLFENHELLQFFHCHKTELSCMDNPQIFLFQLRDHDLIPADSSKRVSAMKSRKNQRRGVYELLDRLEREQPKNIRKFWQCVFKDTILNDYPALRLLRNRLMDGSYREDISESKESEEPHGEKRKDSSEDEGDSVKKIRTRGRDEEEEEPGPSSSSSQPTEGRRKKTNKIRFSSPLKKGEKTDLWMWPLYKLQLPVTCGDLEGTLNRSRLAKGEKCILFQNQWFTPGEFEKRAGKTNCKNWKSSIRCNNTPLAKLIQEGNLEVKPYKGGAQKAKKALFSSDPATRGDESEEDEDQASSDEDQASSDHTDDTDKDEDTEQQPPDESNKVFKVTCGAASGILHKKRFASGTHGMSIRTARRWMSPVDFAKEASCQTDVFWKKDIECEGKPLSDLIIKGSLKIHSPLCLCTLCRPNEMELMNQKNDDYCYVCKRGGDEDAELVLCDDCPCSFHQTCHLPHVEDEILMDDRKWLCTFCVFRSYSYMNEGGMKEVKTRQISGHILQCQYLLLSLCCADKQQTFASDPNLTLPDYSTVIQTPMWLGRVADKLQTRKYQTVGEFVSDVELIFTNCAKFNRYNAEFREEGNRLKQLFQKEFKSVFNISK